MAKSSLQAPRGTRDFYPEEMRLRSWLFEHFRQVASNYAFEEVDVPIVEHAELFTRKAGEEIVDQLYHFELHERHLALRPELTPSIARLVMAKASSLRFPLRWFAIGQNWRYERMTRGRKREHYQWDMEILGEPEVTAEAELIAAIFSLFQRLELPKEAIKLRINSRALLEESLLSGPLKNRQECFPALCVIIDKLSKIGKDAVCDLLSDASGPVALARSEAQDIVAQLEAPSLEDAAKSLAPNSPALTSLRRLFDLLDAYGLADQVLFDASVVRGLAYYTGVVFEAFDTAGSLRAVCGGGRYDGLFQTLGGKATPAVGFGFGDVVILELLRDHQRLPNLPRKLDALVFAFSESERPAAIRLATELRSQNQAIELVLGQSRLKRVLADANRLGAHTLYMIGPDELQKGVVRMRKLQDGSEEDQPLPS